MERPFNPTFFATVAVVLPVIFLALALQSDYLARAFVASRQIDRLSKRQLSEARKRKSKIGKALSLPTYYLSIGIGIAGVLVMFYGIWGEILALLALEQRQAMLATQSIVMHSAIVLIVAATVASVWRIAESFIEGERKAADTHSTGPDRPAAP
jgi:hypothetical protein